MFELLLDDGRELDRVILDGDQYRSTLQRLLLVSVIGLGVFAAIVGLIWPASGLLGASSTLHPSIWAPLVLIGAFLTAKVVCLPSFYFYTQIAGLDAPFHVIVAQSLRVQARSSVVLLGVTPFYAALALASHTDVLGTGNTMTPALIGVALPFIVGLSGLRSLYRSFRRLLDDLPITNESRSKFVMALVLCWSAAFSAVAPVALYRFTELFI
jgi:hypothetical protein